MESLKVAVVQQPPVFLEREATLAGAVQHLATAAEAGAGLAVFPESYVPGYPDWMWRLTPGSPRVEDLHRRLLAESVDLEADGLAALRTAAAEHGVMVVCGVHELDGFSRKTIYNTVVVIGADGSVLNKHRKLMPTKPERMVWGAGDASGLRVVDSELGRVGSLICWENYMPLARFALYAEGVQIYVAPTWDEGDAWISTLKHISREGACWVIGAGCSVHSKDMPATLPHRDEIYPMDKWLNAGDSVVIAPGGEIVAGPLRREHGILYADVELDQAAGMLQGLDVAGHYGRPDIFSLSVDRSVRRPVIETS